MKLALALTAALTAPAAMAGGYTAPIVDLPPAPAPVAASPFKWSGPYAGVSAGRTKAEWTATETVVTPEVTRPKYEDRKVWRPTPKDEQFGGCNHGNDTCPVPVPGTGEWTPNGWTGEWLHEQVEVGREVVTPGGIETIAKAFSQSADTLGAFVGYRHQFASGLVAGAEAGISDSDLGRTLGAEAQLGYALGRALPYAAVGFADTEGHNGWTASLGFDYAATDNLVLGIKATRADYGDVTADTVGVRAAWKF